MSEMKLPEYFEFTVAYTGERVKVYHYVDNIWECFKYHSACTPGTGGKWEGDEIIRNIKSGAWVSYWDSSMLSKPKTIPLSEAVAMVKADIEEPSIEITKKVVVKIKGVTYQAEGEEADKLVELHKQYQILKSVMDALKKYEAK